MPFLAPSGVSFIAQSTAGRKREGDRRQPWRTPVFASNLLICEAVSWYITWQVIFEYDLLISIVNLGFRKRRIYHIGLEDKVRNEDLWGRAGQVPLEWQILQRTLGWIGHTLGKPVSSTTRLALTWNPQGKRRRGRPRNSWRRDTEVQMKQQGSNWARAATTAQDQIGWRRIADGLCSAKNNGPK